MAATPRYVMYILVLAGGPEDIAKAAVCATANFASHPETQAWLAGIFYKRVCRLRSELEWEQAQQCPDFITIPKKVLAFRPRPEGHYPKCFRYFPLCKAKVDDEVGLGSYCFAEDVAVSLILVSNQALTGAVSIAHAAVALWKEDRRFPVQVLVQAVPPEVLLSFNQAPAKLLTESREGGKPVALAFPLQPWSQYPAALRASEPHLLRLE